MLRQLHFHKPHPAEHTRVRIASRVLEYTNVKLVGIATDVFGRFQSNLVQYRRPLLYQSHKTDR